MDKHKPVGPPRDIEASLPAAQQLFTGLRGTLREGGPVLYRAAYSPEGIVPDRIRNPYRFGPPKPLIAAGGTMPFQWLYLAPEVDTTIWEAQFARNDLRQPGTFYLDPGAEQVGLIATITFPRVLRFWDLRAPASSLLGIYDQLSSPDHEWCQWFGVRLHDAMQLVEPADRPDGVLYPSRRYRGQDAMILSFDALEPMRPEITFTATRFVEHASHARLQGDALRSEPPEPVA
ncbi:RES family NAD+ phosphorylase [Burkholderia gladioli]|uniref:RES family NAD+ phosphorylase n=1 Tax=Burkholderia gladioli TaxID=28095 RepID=UPI0016406C4A|nr:RES family NAD+ phosphorylase [Burkholderia gladioli]